MPQYRKATVQKGTMQNGRSAEMGNVPIVLSSRASSVTEWHDVTTRNNQLNKQYYLANTRIYNYKLILRMNGNTIVYYSVCLNWHSFIGGRWH